MILSSSSKELFKLESEECKLITFANPFSYYILEDEFPDSLNIFNYIFADGILLVKLHNVFNRNKINRFSFDFTSLAPLAFNHAVSNNWNVAIVGGSEKEIKKAHMCLESRFKGIKINYFRNGFFKNDEFDLSISKMKDAKINMIVCGMGTPLQENFLIKCKKELPDLKIGFTCGGFLSQISKDENYFHPVFDRFHLRWLQRAYRHSYVRKRLFVDYPRFIIKYGVSKIGK